MDREPRNIVVTGATRGLGLALAVALSRGGHQVFCCGRSASACEQLQTQHPRIQFSAVDVSRAEQVREWADAIVARSGPPDLLVNNASLINRRAPLWELPADEFDRVMAVNVGGVVNVCQAFLPAMVRAGAGIVVNISSSWGRQAESTLAPYCASKFAVEGLTQSLAQELPEGMAAVSLDPGGGIDTEMLRSCLGSEAAQYPSPETWAAMAAPFLLALTSSDNGKALTVQA